MPGTGPRPDNVGPWQVAHAVVRASPPVTSALPFAKLPFGTYAMNPALGSRRSVRSGNAGTSMMRAPIGSDSDPGSGVNMPADRRVFGTVSVSTTLIHGDGPIDPKYSAAAFTSSSVMAFAIWTIRPVLVLRVSALVRRPFLKSAICCVKYATGKLAMPEFSGRPRPFG